MITLKVVLPESYVESLIDIIQYGVDHCEARGISYDSRFISSFMNSLKESICDE